MAGKKGSGNGEGAGFINCVLVLCFVVVLGILSVILPKPSYSEMEKRELASLPEFSVEAVLSGSYVRELSAFYADSFPSRDRFVAAAGVLQAAAGIAYDGITIHQGNETPSVPAPSVSSEPVQSSSLPAQSPDASPSVPPEPESEPEPEHEPEPKPEQDVSLPDNPGAAEEDIAPERAGAILIYNGKGYQIFGGLDSMGAQYAAAVNAYDSALGGEVQVYNLVIPSPIAFGLPARHQSLTTPEHPKIKNIYSQLNDSVISVDVYDRFDAHRDDYIFFGTDHHWTVYGAYLAYDEFIRAAGMEPIPMEQMEKRSLGYDFYGTYYSQTQDNKLRRYPDRVDYFMIDTPHTALFFYRGSPFYGREMSLHAEYAQGVNGYSVFLHGDFPLIKITTENKNGRRIAVVKESFGNAFAPFLVNHYEEVYIVDERYLEVGLVQLIKDSGINELLFINNIFAAHTGYHINRLGQIMYQQYVPPTPQVIEPEPEPQTAPVTDEAGEAASTPPADTMQPMEVPVSEVSG